MLDVRASGLAVLHRVLSSAFDRAITSTAAQASKRLTFALKCDNAGTSNTMGRGCCDEPPVATCTECSRNLDSDADAACRMRWSALSGRGCA
jgi:hypothetical protein